MIEVTDHRHHRGEAMPTVFRLDSSIRVEGSVTRAVTDTLESALTQELSGAEVVRRDVGVAPVAADVWAASTFAADRDQQDGPVAVARELADEVLGADVLLIAAPLYNFGVSQHLKAWVDVLISDPRLGPGTSALAGRPAVLVTARGGGYGEGTPRAGWDHATDWMRRILADVWGLDLTVVETELTLADVTPQMAALRDEAGRQLQGSHEQAHAVAHALARSLHASV
jgi:FMN-dependent NADH-azoreductase